MTTTRNTTNSQTSIISYGLGCAYGPKHKILSPPSYGKYDGELSVMEIVNYVKREWREYFDDDMANWCRFNV